MTRPVAAGVGVVLLAISSAWAAPADGPLVAAVKAGNQDTVRAILRDGSDVDAAQPDGTTALHWATYQGDLDTVDLLLSAGAQADAVNRYEVTPLSMAAAAGAGAIVERLLEAGADAARTVPGGETPLMSVARAGGVRAAEALIAAGADVSAREETRGQTALMWAAAEGHAAVIRTLVAAGADVDAMSRGPKDADVSGGTGTYRRRVERIDALTPFLFAVRSGHLDAVKTLLAAGADVNRTAPDGTSALVFAPANAHWEMGALLLDMGADPNAAEQGWSPLHQVIRTRNLNIGFFPHPEGTGRMSSMEFARWLIAAGADVDARIQKAISDGFRGFWTWTDATALVFAAKGADAEMMRLLAEHGADPTLTNQRRTTLLMAAAGVEMFNPNEDSGTNPEGLAAVEVALELGNDPNAANSSGDTPMHGAAWRGANEIILRLVEAGAKLHVENNRGYTPLQIANGEEEGRVANINVRPWAVALLQDLLRERGLPWELGRTAEERFAFERREVVTPGRRPAAAPTPDRAPAAPMASAVASSEATAFLDAWTVTMESSQVPLRFDLQVRDTGGHRGHTVQ